METQLPEGRRLKLLKISGFENDEMPSSTVN